MMEFLVGYLVGSSTKSSTPMTGRDLMIGLVIIMAFVFFLALVLMIIQTNPSVEASSHVCGGRLSAICNAEDTLMNSLKWVVGAVVALIVAAVALLNRSA